MFKEVLRLYGPVPGIVKKAGPQGITLNGYKIPPGTSLTVRRSTKYCKCIAAAWSKAFFNDIDFFNIDLPYARVL